MRDLISDSRGMVYMEQDLILPKMQNIPTNIATRPKVFVRCFSLLFWLVILIILETEIINCLHSKKIPIFAMTVSNLMMGRYLLYMGMHSHTLVI